MASGDVRDETSTSGWIAALLSHGGGRDDAILLRHAHAAADLERLLSLASLGEALPPSRERRDETLAQGAAFVLAARPWPSPTLDALVAARGRRLPLPVVLGVLAAAHRVGAEATTLAFLHGYAASLVSAAMRLVPLGQTAAVRLARAIEPIVLAVASDTRDATLDALGASCFRSDVAAMRHETLDVRLFRT